MALIQAQINMPDGLLGGTPTGAGIDWVGAVLDRVGPVFERMVEQAKQSTANKDIADAWHMNPPSVSGGMVVFSAENPHPGAGAWETGAVPHEIPQPAHWIPIQPLIEFYEATRGLNPGAARAAAYGFQRWASENPFTIQHPGVQQAHNNVSAAWEAYQGPLQDAAQQAFADSITERMFLG